MSSRSPRRIVGPPAGTELLYEEFKRLVLAQLNDAEALDRKLGVAIAALVAATGAVYAARPLPVVGAVVASWLLVGLIQAVRGFSYEDRFADGPNTTFFRDREQLDPMVIRWHALVAFEAAMEVNESRLRTKGRRLTQVVITLGLVATVGMSGKMLGIA